MAHTASTSYDVVDSMSNVTQQLLSGKVQKWALELSPFFRNIVRDGRNVIRDPNVGEGWKIRRTFRTGLAGAIQPAKLSTDMAIHTSDDLSESTSAGYQPNFQLYGWNAKHVWPTPDDSVSPGYHQWLIRLKNSLGTLHVPLEMLRAARLKANLGDQFNASLEGTAENIALKMVNDWWAGSQAASGVATCILNGIMGKFTSPTSITGSDETLANQDMTIPLTLDSGIGSIRRFREGQRVQLWDNTVSANQWNLLDGAGPLTGMFVVSRVDSLKNTFQLVNISQESITFVAATVYYVTPFYTYGTTIQLTAATIPDCATGIEQLLKTTGYLYGTGTDGINIDRFPIFSSYVQSVGAALDESTLSGYLGRLQHAFSGSRKIDTLVGSEGVWGGFLDNLDGISVYERNGRALDPKGGFEADSDGTFMVFPAWGSNYRCVWDAWASTGTLYGLITRGNNVKLVMPPRLPNALTGQEFDSGVEFVAKIMGGNSIFQGAKDSGGATTNILEAPFYYPYEFLPDQIPGVKLTDISESIGPVLT